MEKEKIAIIGGGVGGMVSAFWLTEKKGWEDRYEITLYQTGWRLGGKGASGRNLGEGMGHRSEEHGVHVWFGLYENAFRTIRAAYEEMGPHGPFKTWRDAFVPSSEGILAEKVKDDWAWWLLRFTTENNGLPGDGRPLPDLWDYLWRALNWLVHNVHEFRDLEDRLATPEERPLSYLPITRQIVGFFRRMKRHVRWAIKKAPTYLHLALLTFESLPRDPAKFLDSDYGRLIDLLDRFKDDLVAHWKTTILEDPEARRLFLTLDLGIACIRGALKGRLLTNGLDVIDDKDFLEWLTENGAQFASLEESAILRGLYGIPFAFEGGDPAKPNFAAGAALRSLTRIFFGYKHSYAFRMQSGMGEIVFTPLYKVLRARGVKFEFFHRVKNLGLSADHRHIERVDIAVQARTKGGFPYDPLVKVPLPGNVAFECWPSEPLWEQIESPAPLAGDPGFESRWSHYMPVETKTLRFEQDFHKVILAIPPSAIAGVCKELVEAKPRWQRMVENVKTTRTLAAQIWMNDDKKAIGWDMEKRFSEDALAGAYEHPINILMDASVILKTETWSEHAPKYLAYFCGPMKDDPEEPKDWHAAEYPEGERQKVVGIAGDWYGKFTRELWPNATQADNPGAIDWQKAFDPKNRIGSTRMEGQYFRCNISPAERYVLSVAGSTEHRIASGESGFANLFLAGDWTRNGLNVGCVEAATVSGMQAARAIAGFPEVIPGERD